MIYRILRFLLVLSVWLAWGGEQAAAQSEGPLPGESERVEVPDPVSVVVGAGTVLDLPGEVDRIAVGNEKLATVTVLSKGQLLIHGDAIGQTTLFAWLHDGRLLRYQLSVRRDMEVIRFLLADLDEGIQILERGDGHTLLLQGSVPTARLAAQAESRVREILIAGGVANPSVVNLMDFPEATRYPDPDERLAESLRSIDPRITVRRIRVSAVEEESAGDSYVLEGRVRTIAQLTRAVMLADRQLGGTGGTISAADDSSVRFDRVSSFQGGLGLSGGGTGQGAGLGVLQGIDPPSPGLAAQVARGLVLTSESGRVISFLGVDDLHQVLVSIRVMEINRDKARSLGINYRVDGTHFSLANRTAPLGGVFDNARAVPASVSGIGVGNYVGAYVSSSVAVLTAIDALQRDAVARSVAEPNVMTLAGEQATVIVGGEVPIPTTSVGQVAAVQGFLFQSFGVRLDIRPTVDSEGIITMEVAPSIVRPDQGIGVGEVPGFQIESVQTIARVRGGESLVLGGLLNYEEVDFTRKVPILGDIPILGQAFKWQSKAREERELLFVITPRIMDELGVEGIDETVDLPASGFRDLRLGKDVFPQPGLEPDGRPVFWVDEQERVRVETERRAMLDTARRNPPRHHQLFPWSRPRSVDGQTNAVSTEAEWLDPALMTPVPRGSAPDTESGATDPVEVEEPPDPTPATPVPGGSAPDTESGATDPVEAEEPPDPTPATPVPGGSAPDTESGATDPVEAEEPPDPTPATPVPSDEARTLSPQSQDGSSLESILEPLQKPASIAPAPSADGSSVVPSMEQIDLDAEDILAPLKDEAGVAPVSPQPGNELPTPVFRVGPFRYALPAGLELGPNPDRDVLSMHEGDPAVVVSLAPVP